MAERDPCSNLHCFGVLRPGELRCAHCGTLRIQLGVELGDGAVVSVLGGLGVRLRAWEETSWYGVSAERLDTESPGGFFLIMRSPPGSSRVGVRLSAHPDERDYIVRAPSKAKVLEPGHNLMLQVTLLPRTRDPDELLYSLPGDSSIRVDLEDLDRRRPLPPIDVPVFIANTIAPEEIRGCVTGLRRVGADHALVGLNPGALNAPLYLQLGRGPEARMVPLSKGDAAREVLLSTAAVPEGGDGLLELRIQGTDAVRNTLGGVSHVARLHPERFELPALKLGDLRSGDRHATVWVFSGRGESGGQDRSEERGLGRAGATKASSQWVDVPVNVAAQAPAGGDAGSVLPVSAITRVEIETAERWRALEFETPRPHQHEGYAEPGLPIRPWRLALNLPPELIPAHGALFRLRVEGLVQGLGQTPRPLFDGDRERLTVATISPPAPEDWVIALDIGTSNTVAVFGFRRASDDAEGTKHSMALNVARLGALDSTRPGQVPSELWVHQGEDGQELGLEPTSYEQDPVIPYIKLRFLKDDEEEEGDAGLRLRSREVLEVYIGQVIDRLRQVVPVPLERARWIFSFPARWEVSRRFRETLEGTLTGVLQDVVGPEVRPPVFIDEGTAASVRFARYIGAVAPARVERHRTILMVIDIGGGTTDPALLRLVKHPGDPRIRLEPLGRSFPRLWFNVSGEELTNVFQDVLVDKLTDPDNVEPSGLARTEATEDRLAWQATRELARHIKERPLGQGQVHPKLDRDELSGLRTFYPRFKNSAVIDRLLALDLQAVEEEAVSPGYLARVVAMVWEVLDALVAELALASNPSPTLLLPVLTGGGSRHPVIRELVEQQLSSIWRLAPVAGEEPAEPGFLPKSADSPYAFATARIRSLLRNPQDAIPMASGGAISDAGERLLTNLERWRESPPSLTRESVSWTEHAFEAMTRALTQRTAQRSLTLPVGGKRRGVVTPFLRDLDPKLITAVGAATVLLDEEMVELAPPIWSPPLSLRFGKENPELPLINLGAPIVWSVPPPGQWAPLNFGRCPDQRLSGQLSVRVLVDGVEEEVGVVSLPLTPAGELMEISALDHALSIGLFEEGAELHLRLMITYPDGRAIELPVEGFTWSPLKRPAPRREDRP